MKKFFAVFFGLVLTVGLIGCGQGNDQPEQPNQQQPAQQPEQQPRQDEFDRSESSPEQNGMDQPNRQRRGSERTEEAPSMDQEEPAGESSGNDYDY